MSRTFVPGTVSHGTLRTEDLANAFIEALEMVSPEAYQQLVFPSGFACEGIRALDNGPRDPYWDTDAAQDFVAMLSDTLSEHAPEGYYFGAHEGDGSDFGFWAIEAD